MKDTLKELNEITNYLSKIKRLVEGQILIEGVYDPGVLKCVFMAGGPGSGKSFVAKSLFGVDKLSLSYTGLKPVNSDTAFEAALKKNGIDPKDLARIEKEDPELWNKITEFPGGIREKAKGLTAKQKQLYEAGRLGLIIDGTGENYSKIANQRKHAMDLGYDCYMVFVNTSLEVAMENNRKRARTLPDSLVQEAWKNCQENMGKFQTLFGGSHFRIVDNSNRSPVSSMVSKSVAQFVNAPIQNPIGKKWVEQQKQLKAAGLL